MTRKEQPWRWRPAARDGDRVVELRYEPGNWGDLLKGAWALEIAARILEQPRRRERCFTYLDPFAGAPCYPISEAARARRRSLPAGPILERILGGIAAEHWPSTARLVAELLERRGVRAELLLYDHDPGRRAAWQEEAGGAATLLSGGSATAVFDAVLAQQRILDLVLVDPYELFHHWGRWLGRVERAACGAAVLCYLHNPSPRGPGHRDQYRRLRQHLAELASAGTELLLGRLASDARAPRAHHEVVLAAPRPLLEPLCARLRRVTELLARVQNCDNPFIAFEKLGGPAARDGNGRE